MADQTHPPHNSLWSWRSRSLSSNPSSPPPSGRLNKRRHMSTARRLRFAASRDGAEEDVGDEKDDASNTSVAGTASVRETAAVASPVAPWMQSPRHVWRKNPYLQYFYGGTNGQSYDSHHRARDAANSQSVRRHVTRQPAAAAPAWWQPSAYSPPGGRLTPVVRYPNAGEFSHLRTTPAHQNLVDAELGQYRSGFRIPRPQLQYHASDGLYQYQAPGAAGWNQQRRYAPQYVYGGGYAYRPTYGFSPAGRFYDDRRSDDSQSTYSYRSSMTSSSASSTSSRRHRRLASNRCACCNRRFLAAVLAIVLGLGVFAVISSVTIVFLNNNSPNNNNSTNSTNSTNPTNSTKPINLAYTNLVLRLPNQVFTPSLNNPNSPDFKTTSLAFCTAMETEVFSKVVVACIVHYFRNGSIIVDATLTLDEDALANLTGSNASSANIANYVGVALSNIPTSNSSLLANAEVKSITYSTAVETLIMSTTASIVTDAWQPAYADLSSPQAQQFIHDYCFNVASIFGTSLVDSCSVTALAYNGTHMTMTSSLTLVRDASEAAMMRYYSDLTSHPERMAAWVNDLIVHALRAQLQHPYVTCVIVTTNPLSATAVTQCADVPLLPDEEGSGGPG